jgi:hypothetical protein
MSEETSEMIEKEILEDFGTSPEAYPLDWNSPKLSGRRVKLISGMERREFECYFYDYPTSVADSVLTADITKSLTKWRQPLSDHMRRSHILLLESAIQSAMGWNVLTIKEAFASFQNFTLPILIVEDFFNDLCEQESDKSLAAPKSQEISQERERILSEAYGIRQAMATLLAHDWAGLKILLHVKESTRLLAADLKDKFKDIEADVLLSVVINLVSHEFLKIDEFQLCITERGNEILEKLLNEK